MADETTTTTANDIVITQLHNGIVEEARPLVLPYKSFHSQASPFTAARVVTVGQVTDPGAAASIAEATDETNTAIGTDGGNVTASEQGIMATPTDVLAASSPLGASWVGPVLARSYAERVGDLFCALYDDFSNTSGTTTADLTLQQFAGAVAALAGRDAPGPYLAVLHPQQVLDLRMGSGNTPGGILPGPGANLTGLDFTASPAFRQTIMDSIQREAYAGNLLGVDVWQTSAVVTMTNGADRGGAIFNKEAIFFHELWDMRTELQRDASLRATEIVVSGNLGVAEIKDGYGQTITSDA